MRRCLLQKRHFPALTAAAAPPAAAAAPLTAAVPPTAAASPTAAALPAAPAPPSAEEEQPQHGSLSLSTIINLSITEAFDSVFSCHFLQYFLYVTMQDGGCLWQMRSPFFRNQGWGNISK
jgi:hypothetical protein